MKGHGQKAQRLLHLRNASTVCVFRSAERVWASPRRRFVSPRATNFAIFRTAASHPLSSSWLRKVLDLPNRVGSLGPRDRATETKPAPEGIAGQEAPRHWENFAGSTNEVRTSACFHHNDCLQKRSERRPFRRMVLTAYMRPHQTWSRFIGPAKKDGVMRPPSPKSRKNGRRRSTHWSFRISPSVYRNPIPKLVLVAVLAWLGWQIVANTAADTLANSDPEAALTWRPNHSAALVSLAELTVRAGNEAETETDGASEPNASETDSAEVVRDPAAVGALASRALRANPLEEGTLRLLALVAEAGGEQSRAVSLMQLAAAQSKRDIRVQAWLLNERLVAGDLPGALKSVDAMLRTWPEATEFVQPILVGLASDPDGALPVVDLLEGDPPWRGWFLQMLPGQVSDPRQLEAFFASLKQGPSPPTVAEYRPFLNRLVALGDLQNAYAIRADMSPEEWMGGDDNVNNGGFEYPVSGLPFGWIIAPIRGADSEVVSESAANRALRVQFHNTRVPYRNVSQLLFLRPGYYNLSGRFKAAALKNDRGLQWTVSCYAGRKAKLGATERFSGTMKWTAFDAAFVVPAENGCEAQLLRLELPARVPAEQKISGGIWFDDLTISRAELGPG